MTTEQTAPRTALPRAGALVLPFALAVLLCACQGRTLFRADGSGGAAPGPVAAGGVVDLSARDLAPVDAWISTRNSQWILGDDVTVYASREYFAQHLTVTAQVGMVRREDRVTPDETIVTLTFIGRPESAAIERNPRVLIGTGLTITARRTLTVRLARTRDANVPVQLRVVAEGGASRGRKQQVLDRGPALTIGGDLRRTAAGWTWTGGS